MGLLSRVLTVFKVKANSALDRAEDPRELLNYAYEQQQGLLLKTKQGLVEVATSKAWLVQESERLRARLPQAEIQARRALESGREELAQIVLQRKQSVLAELERLDLQIADVSKDEIRLTRAKHELSVRIDEFRTRRGVISARYTAAQAQVRAVEALTGTSAEFSELSMALGRAMEKTDRMEARATAIGELLDQGSLDSLGHVADPVEGELLQIEMERTAAEELTALKLRVHAGESDPALNPGRDDGARECRQEKLWKGD